MMEVSTYGFYDIYQKYPNIVVPNYQRAYTWDKEKVDELLTDWDEYLQKEPRHSYYMGTLLFFYDKEKKGYEIIDGQQRLTTLALIYQIIKKEFLSGQDLVYNQMISAYNIANNFNFLTSKKEQLQQFNKADIFSKLDFTIIVSDNQDHAFSFFDSQNNRGVSLGVDDYLKAYHLRALPEPLQAKRAKDWEAITFKAKKQDDHLLDLKHLFNEVLFKVRKWRGQTTFPYPNKNNVLGEFQKNTHKSNNEENFRLFPNRNNMRFQEIEVNNDGLNFISREKPISIIEYPFAIRQPIYKGQNFFDFTEKYHSIFDLFFNESGKKTKAIQDSINFYNAIYTRDMSAYLRYYMQMCLVAYYDNFGEEKLFDAIQYFDYYIGSVRLEKYYVRHEAIKNSLKIAELNLIDLIINAYLPNEIFSFIKGAKSIDDVYWNKKFLNDKGNLKNSVIERYIKRVCDFYGVDIKNDKYLNEFKSRKQWIR
ncbi:DUF262 domain-containing protein [Aquiflexum gelatinilyticum]|uniref:DUF262 domain-containing protein n=1 Tax=Aquiflexum gelatinilyticum TaxID=2961943 RepID=UPI002168154B|nr:DUF262 domain-containing protein [Aquiflexum gelatinilyticum]MCS4435337.1 DUF262 domain-containing protein [Aquiflexum gelatinilyticum]